MTQNLDLKAIERKAFRSTHQDGLWDIYIGITMLVCALLLNIPDNEDFPLPVFVLGMAGMGIAFAIFHFGKKFITVPRMGRVKFGPGRQKRKITLAWVMGAFVMVTLGLNLFTLYVWNASSSAQPVELNLAPSLERAVVASIAALIAGLSTIVISYYKEFTRGYYIALLMGIGFFFAMLLDTPVPVVVAAALILLPGLYVFLRFLRGHPLPQDIPNDQS